MKKMNKKGFTLIEMLVVIAIIAVLVAIIIPTVTSATGKAEAAANAANLRSIKAEIVTAMQTDDDTATNVWAGVKTQAVDASTKVVTLTTDQVAYVKKVFGEAEAATTAFQLKIDGSNVTVLYNSNDIDTWAGKAK